MLFRSTKTQFGKFFNHKWGAWLLNFLAVSRITSGHLRLTSCLFIIVQFFQKRQIFVFDHHFLFISTPTFQITNELKNAPAVWITIIENRLLNDRQASSAGRVVKRRLSLRRVCNFTWKYRIPVSLRKKFSAWQQPRPNLSSTDLTRPSCSEDGLWYVVYKFITGTHANKILYMCGITYTYKDINLTAQRLLLSKHLADFQTGGEGGVKFEERKGAYYFIKETRRGEQGMFNSGL